MVKYVKTSSPRPQIQNYLDYREFLRDLFAQKQIDIPGYTQRKLALDGSFGLGLFTKVIQGERDISAKMLVKFSDVFALSETETDEFEELVNYNQAKTPQEKLERLKILMSRRAQSKTVHTLEERFYQFYSQWYHTAIREIISSGKFIGSYKELGNLLQPKLPVKYVKSSIQLLLSLELIKEISNKDGLFQWEVNNPLISSGEDLAKSSVRKFNIDMMEKAREALDLFNAQERNISTVTLSFDRDKYNILADKIKGFRKEIMDLAVSDNHSNQVFQLNIQLFPLSKCIQEDKL